MANNIEINVIARDMASSVFNSITSQMGSLGSAIQGLASGNYLQAIASGFQFVSEAVSETVSYIDQVDDMALAIGVTAEESARLIQASEKLGVAQGDLQRALEFAVRKGVDVSIDGIKNLSTEYTNIQDPTDRATFLMKTFGQSGEDMGKMLELGADGINKAMDAVNDMLVPTEDAKKAVDDYNAAVEDLNDTFMGVKVTIGNEVIPKLTGFLDIINGVKSETPGLTGYMRALGEELDNVAGSGGAAAGTLGSLGTASDTATTGFEGLGNSLTPVTTLFKDLTTEMIYNEAAAGLDYQAQLDLGFALGKINESTYAAMLALQEAREEYKNTGDLDKLVEKVKHLNYYLNGLPAGGKWHYSFEFDYYYNEHGTKPNPHGYTNPWDDPDVGWKAYGGFTQSNTPYIVGEQGPELFVPNAAGKVIPNNQLGGGGGAQFDYDRMARAFAQELQRGTFR